MEPERNEKRLSEAQIHQISKRAAKALIKRCGGIDGAAGACRIRRSALADCANVNNRNRYLPLDVILSLEQLVAKLVVTDLLARAQGYVTFPIPVSPPDSIWQKHLNRTVRKSSRLFKHILDALRDDEINSEEARDLLDQTDSTLAAIGSLRSSLIMKIEAGRTVRKAS